MFKLIDRLSNYSMYMFGELIGFFVLLLYIYYINRLNFMEVNVILHDVICIGIYQLIINKYVLSRVFIRFDKYRFKNITLERSCKIHKNSNYMSMGIITMFSYINNIYDLKILYALTLLFLFDTYIGNRKELLTEEKNFN
ncbi:hypothetical protein [Clostridium tepidiprofundi]|nr:hypothetical protein [Clostridium tepidiprofundi]